MKEKLKNLYADLDISRLLALIFIANLGDAFLTLRWIDAGIATEANPMMNFLLQQGVGWFLVGKISFVLASCFILWKARHVKLAKPIALISAIAYVGLIIFHLIGAHNAGLNLFGIT